MLRFKSRFVSLLVIFTFLFSTFVSTGALSPRLAFAWHAPKQGDQGHPSSWCWDWPYAPPFEPCVITGSPAHLNAGNYFYSHQDLFIPGRGLSLEITRYYNSQDQYEGPFGHGWHFVPFMKLVETTKGSDRYVILNRGDGVRLIFKENPDGSYTTLYTRRDVLVKNADGTYTLREYG